MSLRNVETVTFEAEKVLQPIFTGGDVSIDAKGQILAASLGDQVVLTNVQNGEMLVRIEGVSCIWQA